MQFQILNSFKGDDIRDIDTSTPEGKATASKMIENLLRTGSALFMEQEIDGKVQTFRIVGYDEAADRVKLASREPAEVKPDEHNAPIKRGRGRPRKEEVSTPSNSGRLVSVAPVSGGTAEARLG